MADQILYPKAYHFAVRAVKVYQHLIKKHREYTLSKQILKSGTSIGANIAEANGAISKDDFSHKMSLAYKESLETLFWLDLLKDTDYLQEKHYLSLYKDAEEIAKILFSILKTTRINTTKNTKTKKA